MVIFHNAAKPEARRQVPRLATWLRKKGVQVLPHARAAEAQAAVALGGDGTLLAAARRMAPHGTPVLGINFGRLGFLAATEVASLPRTLAALLSDRLVISNRMMLQVEGPRKGAPRLALNDCVIRGSDTARLIRLSAWVDGQLLAKYVGDGLILATPTGSTAYSLAASGPIVQPDMDLILLTPICSHSLTQRPVILAPHCTVEIRVEEHTHADKVVMSLDGQINIPLRAGDSVFVRRAQERFRLYSDGRRPFFSILREKLKWGER